MCVKMLLHRWYQWRIRDTVPQEAIDSPHATIHYWFNTIINTGNDIEELKRIISHRFIWSVCGKIDFSQLRLLPWEFFVAISFMEACKSACMSNLSQFWSRYDRIELTLRRWKFRTTIPYGKTESGENGDIFQADNVLVFLQCVAHSIYASLGTQTKAQLSVGELDDALNNSHPVHRFIFVRR